MGPRWTGTERTSVWNGEGESGGWVSLKGQKATVVRLTFAGPMNGGEGKARSRDRADQNRLCGGSSGGSIPPVTAITRSMEGMP